MYFVLFLPYYKFFGCTSVRIISWVLSLGFLKHPEREFLAPDPLRSIECVQRAEQDVWAFGGEAVEGLD